MKMHWILLLLTCVVLGLNRTAQTESSGHLYVTGTVMEIDRCASAWLIKRYVDVDARFEFLTDEELMTTGMKSFDTPYSQLRRTHTASTFETIQREYAVDDKKVEYLAVLIHELEINFWNKKMEKRAVQFQVELEKLLREAGDNRTALQLCFTYLDSLAFE